MNSTNIIILLYNLYTKLPYILTFIFFVLSIYYFIKKDDENFINALISIGFGILSIISYLICFKLILPNLLTTNPGDILYSLYIFISDVVIVIANLILIPFISLGIVDFDNTISNRLKYSSVPIITFGCIFFVEKVFSIILL